MTFLPKLSAFLPYFPAVFSGILLTAGFPDLHLYALAFFALVPLWVSIDGMAPRQAFYAGLTAGIVHYLTLIYWIVPTLTEFGKLHIILALSCLVLLCLYLAFYMGLFAYIMKKTTVPAWITPVWGGLAWTGLEFVRTHAMTGFPWGILGYTQYANTVLVQTADLFGVLGISFILVTINGVIARAWLVLGRKGPKTDRISDLAVPLACGLVLVMGALGYGHFRLAEVNQWMAHAPHSTISVIQGNIEQDKKWDKAFQDFTLNQYEALSMAALPADLVIWPETALPFYYGRDPVHSSRVDALVRKARTHFILGSPAVEISEDKVRYYNRALMLNPLAQVTATYDKTHLVPFGEYVPLQDWLFFVKKLTQEAGNFSRGRPDAPPLAFGSHRTGMLICFEILFPDIAREFVLRGADILTTITNDAWFGRTSAPAQHFSIAVLRAVENRRSIVRAANTGISGFIDPAGRIMANTRIFTPAALTREIPVLSQTTFYTRHGDLPGKAVMIALALICIGRRFYGKKAIK